MGEQLRDELRDQQFAVEPSLGALVGVLEGICASDWKRLKTNSTCQRVRYTPAPPLPGRS